MADQWHGLDVGTKRMTGILNVLLGDNAAAAGGGGATSWNPADKASDMTISTTTSANDTFNGPNNTGSGVRSIAHHSTGKYYWEISVTQAFTGMRLGIADSAAPIGGGDLGAGVHGLSYAQDGAWYYSGAPTTPAGGLLTYTGGDLISFAVDMGNAKFWFRKGSGNWNNDASANPATNTNGITLGSITDAYAAVSTGTTGGGGGGIGTANFGATAFAQTPPSGFGNL
jgi:hypothetical protein